MKKILITGGSGFIGAEIVKQLFKTCEWNITVLDCMSQQIHGENWEDSYLYKSIKNKCHFIRGNVCEFNTIQKAIGENEYIIHLAAETGTGQSMYQINKYNKINIMGTSNLLQAISSMESMSKVKKVILASSRAVYGEGKYQCKNCGVVFPSARKKNRMLEKDFKNYCDYCGEMLEILPTTEDSLITPNSLYAFTKFAQEEMLKIMCQALDIEYTIFRFQNVYGVGQSLKNPYTGILSIFSTLMLENKAINIFEDGLESRDFINVIDVAKGVVSSLENKKSNSQVINLGSGKRTSVIELAELLKQIYKSNSEINITGDFRVGDIAHNMADIMKAKEILGFEQSISLIDGLATFGNWVIGQNKDNRGYEMSLREMESAGMFVRCER